MAPPAGKRVKGTQIFRPFIYGTTARPFNDTDNPKPSGVPADHTHSWQVFVKGIEDTDVFYWLRRVQFKLHESIPNHLRTLDAEAIIKENDGLPADKKKKGFIVNETGWGEFEITIKLYYDSKSSEKPQTLYHHLRLHPYGRTEAEKETMRNGGEVRAWVYEEQLFNEPYEEFYKILTSGAHKKGTAPGGPKNSSGGGGKGKGKGTQPPGSGGGDSNNNNNNSTVLERSALIPPSNKPGQPFSTDSETLEIKRLKEAQDMVQRMISDMNKGTKAKEAELAELKTANANAAAA